MKISIWLKTTLLLISMMTMMAGAVVAPSLPLIAQNFSGVNGVELLTRLVITLPAIFIAFTAPIIGILIDKYGRKNILLISMILYGISGTSGYFLNDLYSILVGRAFLGLAVAGVMTVSITLIGDYFKGEERNKFMGLQGAFMGLGGVFFISLSGILADINWNIPFLIYLFSFVMLPFAILFLYEPNPETTESIDLKEESKTDYSKLVEWVIYFTVFISIVFFYMIPVQIPFLLKGIPGLSNAQVGYAISAATITSAIIAMNYNRIKKRLIFTSIFSVAFFFMAIGYIIISYSEFYFQFLIGLATTGFGTGLIMPSGSLWIMKLAPAHMRGRMVGRVSTSMFLGMFFSPIIFQPIINNSSVSGAFFVAAMSLVILSVVFQIYRKD